MIDHADVAMAIASTFAGQLIAEKDEAEDRGLDRLGLQVRRRHHERAVVHRQQHQCRGGDLAEGAEQQPGPERRDRPRRGIAGDRQHNREEDDRKRKSEQKADIGRAPGPERTRQRPLHRIAGDLPERSNDGEGNAERGDGEHGGIPGGGCRTVPGAVERSTVTFACDLRPLGHHHVVHVHVGRDAPSVGERAVDHPGLLGDGELVVGQVPRQFIGGDELVPRWVPRGSQRSTYSAPTRMQSSSSFGSELLNR